MLLILYYFITPIYILVELGIKTTFLESNSLTDALSNMFNPIMVLGLIVLKVFCNLILPETEPPYQKFKKMLIEIVIIIGLCVFVWVAEALTPISISTHESTTHSSQHTAIKKE